MGTSEALSLGNGVHRPPRIIPEDGILEVQVDILSAHTPHRMQRLWRHGDEIIISCWKMGEDFLNELVVISLLIVLQNLRCLCPGEHPNCLVW